MAEKKYVLKTQSEKFDDGTNNDEHVLDIIKEIEMLYSNIQDNNDIGMQLFKLKEQADVDKDILDAIEIGCENLIQLEKEGYAVLEVVYKHKEKLDKNCEEVLRGFLKQMVELAKKSEKTLTSLLV